MLPLQRTMLVAVVALVAILLVWLWNSAVAALLAFVTFAWVIVSLARSGQGVRPFGRRRRR